MNELLTTCAATSANSTSQHAGDFNYFVFSSNACLTGDLWAVEPPLHVRMVRSYFAAHWLLPRGVDCQMGAMSGTDLAALASAAEGLISYQWLLSFGPVGAKRLDVATVRTHGHGPTRKGQKLLWSNSPGDFLDHFWMLSNLDWPPFVAVVSPLKVKPGKKGHWAQQALKLFPFGMLCPV